MHQPVRDYIARQTAGRRWETVVEFGSRNLNGTVRDVVDHTSWCGLDLLDGPDVDVVEDAAVWAQDHGGCADLVVCCEVLEHHPDPAVLVAAAAKVLRDGGMLLVTCATDPRTPHSGLRVDGTLAPGEHYRNIARDALHAWMTSVGLVVVDVDTSVRGDLYATAVKGAS